MWTASITSAQRVNADASVSVQYTDGTNVLSETYHVSDPNQLKQTVINKIAQLGAVDSFLASTTTGPVDTSVPVVIPTVPTQAQLNQQVFVADLATLKQMKTAIAQGLKTNTDADYVALVAKLKAEYLPSYLPLIS